MRRPRRDSTPTPTGTTSTATDTGATTPTTRKPRRRLINMGLRARLTFSYTLGAAILSAILSVTAFALTRENLMRQREDVAVSQAVLNAGTVSEKLDPGLDSKAIEQVVLASLPTPAGGQTGLRYKDTWYAKNSLKFSQDDLPPSLVSTVDGGKAARMVTSIEGVPTIIIGIPLPNVNGSYFEAASLSELQKTLDGFAISLLGASVVTTLAGAMVGLWAARRVFTPLLDVGRAAQAIAGGHLDTRLPTGRLS